MYDSNGNVMSKTQILRKLYYERQLQQMTGIRNGLLQNVSVDKNLQKVLEYISQDEYTAMPKRNALSILDSIKSDLKRANKLDTYIINPKSF